MHIGKRPRPSGLGRLLHSARERSVLPVERTSHSTSSTSGHGLSRECDTDLHTQDTRHQTTGGSESGVRYARATPVRTFHGCSRKRGCRTSPMRTVPKGTAILPCIAARGAGSPDVVGVIVSFSPSATQRTREWITTFPSFWSPTDVPLAFAEGNDQNMRMF